jgi:membrane protease YdiL (CAAX protease family)
MPTSAANIAGSIELVLAAAGLVLLWRLVLSPAARRRRSPPALPEWPAPISEFLFFIVYILVGSLVMAVAAGLLAKQLPLRGDAVTVFNGAAAQLGMLAGFFLYHFRADSPTLRTMQPSRRIVTAGAVTFLMSLPLLMLTAKVSEYVLEKLGLPTDKQDLVHMFAEADSPVLLSIMIALAVLIAPLTEELVFRAGLFRYARTRMPRVLALLVPALFFASLHVNWNTLMGLSSLVPLVVLAVTFSLAYERTGHIGTAIVAHALFNLNTVLLILSGVAV